MQSTVPGEGFEPTPAQQLHMTAAQLYQGSSPAQLLSLELALQQHFKAPSFEALGHGASLLQCCSQDEAMMQIVAEQATTVPLSKVRCLLPSHNH